ncbi:unnamed protein product [Prorocentrum cordatum]|uniref:DnaJ homolog subfamily C member 2 n=1 Tax=Prorocentrum cordatum TaxID=2364126 RepID=A0ABN9UC20_9DINO|nr:unnamed protein product [Polarella glacialis]
MECNSQATSKRWNERLCRLCVCCLIVVAPCTAEKYCGKDNCYELLGVRADADTFAIKRAYRKLSLKWHPDKNVGKEEEATQMFTKIAAAYEVLSDDEMRASYDYALEHPEQAMYNNYRYYKTMVGQKVSLQSVFIGFVAFMSLLQYVNQTSLCRQHRSIMMKAPGFKGQLKDAVDARVSELRLRSSVDLSAKEKNAIMETLFCNCQVDGMSLAPVGVANLFIVQLALLPMRVIAYIREAPARRSLRHMKAEEERFHREREKAELLKRQQVEEDTLRRRLAGKDRKQKDELDRERAKERAREERRREELERKRETDERCEAGRRAREYITAAGKDLGFSVEELRPILSLGSDSVVAAAKDLETSGPPELLRDRFRAMSADLKASASRERELQEKVDRTPWAQDELAALAKGMNRFPGGSPNRWGKICNFIEQVTGKRRSEADATDKARGLSSLAGQASSMSQAPSQIDKTVSSQIVETRSNEGSDARSTSAKFDSLSDDSIWSQAQQAALEKALVTYPASLGLTTAERWDKISACVEGKSRKQCAERFKALRDQVKSA